MQILWSNSQTIENILDSSIVSHLHTIEPISSEFGLQYLNGMQSRVITSREAKSHRLL